MTGGFAVGRADASVFPAQPVTCFSEQPTPLQATLVYLQPYAWPASLLTLGLGLVAASLTWRLRSSLGARRRAWPSP